MHVHSTNKRRRTEQICENEIGVYVCVCVCWFTTFIFLRFYLFLHRIRHFTACSRFEYNGGFMGAIPWASSLFATVYTEKCMTTDRAVPIFSFHQSIQYPKLSTQVCSFARSLSIIDLLELVWGKIIKFNAFSRKSPGYLFPSNESSEQVSL